VRTGYASDAKSFFAYIKEIAEPMVADHGGREGRQLGLANTGPLSVTFALNGVSNFSKFFFFVTALLNTSKIYSIIDIFK
jgi:hypothetical protein